jgi:hypothetical protein
MSMGDDVSRETPAVPAHYCIGVECPLHGHGDAAVEIERIKAKRDIEVAKIGRGEYEHTAEVRAETDIAVAEIQAAAGVEETAALAEGIADSGEPPEIEITDVPIPDAEPEVQATIEPRDDETDDGAPPPPAKSSSWSYW